MDRQRERSALVGANQVCAPQMVHAREEFAEPSFWSTRGLVGHRHEHSQYRRRRVFSKAGQSLAVLVVNVLSRLLKRGK